MELAEVWPQGLSIASHHPKTTLQSLIYQFQFADSVGGESQRLLWHGHGVFKQQNTWIVEKDLRQLDYGMDMAWLIIVDLPTSRWLCPTQICLLVYNPH